MIPIPIVCIFLNKWIWEIAVTVKWGWQNRDGCRTKKNFLVWQLFLLYRKVRLIEQKRSAWMCTDA